MFVFIDVDEQIDEFIYLTALNTNRKLITLSL